MTKENKKELLELAIEAFIYGYPLVFDINTVIYMSASDAQVGCAPVNMFGFAARLAGPSDKFVSINNDSMFAIAQVYITDEPQVLHVPDTQDRYYVMQMVDAWSNNFAYVGKRGTGTKEGYYLLAGLGWKGDVPDGMVKIQVPSKVFSIVGRYSADGPNGVQEVRKLQKQTWLTPLSLYPDLPNNSARKFGDHTVATWNEAVPVSLEFWEQMRAFIGQFPPPPAEHEYIKKFAPLGLLEANSPYVKPDSDLTQVLQQGEQEGKAWIEKVSGEGKKQNGWSLSLHVFDYNMDYFEIGTINSPEWVISDRTKAHKTRAIAARAGLWGNHGYEAYYRTAFVDDQNEQLSGSKRYTIHFDSLPPVHAFWSITMYNMPEYYLVDNPINRYSIGSNTPGLKINLDGSLDLYIQKDSPGKDKASNWLPAAAGDFRPILRLYMPGEALLDGSYEIPPIRQVT